MEIKKIEKGHVREVAALHAEYIPAGFLSSLGPGFLELLYGAMINADSAFCLVAVEDGKAVGFAAGASKVAGFYKEFLRKDLFGAVCAIAAKAVRPRVFRKIAETLFYPGKGTVGLPESELLSIAVSDKFQGRGVSASLFRALAEEFERRGVKRFKAVVGSEMERARRFYEKNSGVLSAEIEVHKGEKSGVYVWG